MTPDEKPKGKLDPVLARDGLLRMFRDDMITPTVLWRMNEQLMVWDPSTLLAVIPDPAAHGQIALVPCPDRKSQRELVLSNFTRPEQRGRMPLRDRMPVPWKR